MGWPKGRPRGPRPPTAPAVAPEGVGGVDPPPDVLASSPGGDETPGEELTPDPFPLEGQAARGGIRIPPPFYKDGRVPMIHADGRQAGVHPNSVAIMEGLGWKRHDGFL